MSKSIIWVNGDNLNPNARVFADYTDAPAIFIFDEALLAQWNISFKRIVFMYECLLEMDVTIRKGDIVDEIEKFAFEHGAEEIVTMSSPSPRFRKITDDLYGKLDQQVKIHIVNEIPIVDTDYAFDLKRFSRYWRKAKPYAMRYK